jgi:RecA-family ATPase
MVRMFGATLLIVLQILACAGGSSVGATPSRGGVVVVECEDGTKHVTNRPEQACR